MSITRLLQSSMKAVLPVSSRSTARPPRALRHPQRDAGADEMRFVPGRARQTVPGSTREYASRWTPESTRGTSRLEREMPGALRELNLPVVAIDADDRPTDVA